MQSVQLLLLISCVAVNEVDKLMRMNAKAINQ